MDPERRSKTWRHWCSFVAKWHRSPYLVDCSKAQQAHILATFAVGIRQGEYGRGRRVTAQSVGKALSAVGQTIQMAGYDDPTKIYGGRERILPLRRLLEAYTRADPAPRPQLAVPASTIEFMQAEAERLGRQGRTGAVADLATLAFFYLLRVGEYTMPARRTRTVQFRVCDVTFYRQGLIVPNSAPIATLMQADGLALRIDNQKNGTRGETIHHHAIPGRRICPIQAAARRVSAILAQTNERTTPISLIDADAASHVRAADIRTALRRAVTSLRLDRQGIRAADVGSHSLRAGGAMAMKLNGCDLITIMKMGRWSSLTFLTYIHNQVAHLSANISHRMANAVPFFNFG